MLNFKNLTFVLAPLAVAALAGCSSQPMAKDEGSNMTPSNTTTKIEQTKDVEKAETIVAGRLSCSVEGDKRYIEVRKKGEGCETIYFKFDKEDVVATAANGLDHCEGIRDRIQKNLTAAGFSCN